MGLCQLAGAVMPALSAETGKGMATRLVHHRSTVMVAGIPPNASLYQGARAYCPSPLGHSSPIRLSSVAYGLPMRLRLSSCALATISMCACCLRAPVNAFRLSMGARGASAHRPEACISRNPLGYSSLFGCQGSWLCHMQKWQAGGTALILQAGRAPPRF